MALTYLWSGFFIVGFLAAMAQWIFLGDGEVFKRIIDGTFDSARVAVMEIALPLAGVMTLWLGILAIGEKAGAIDFIAKLIRANFGKSHSLTFESTVILTHQSSFRLFLCPNFNLLYLFDDVFYFHFFRSINVTIYK